MQSVHPQAIESLLQGIHGDPFSVLGPHSDGQTTAIRVLRPGIDSVAVVDGKGKTLAELTRTHPAGFFEGEVKGNAPTTYQLRMSHGASRWTEQDPYRFGSGFGELDIYLLAAGNDKMLYHKLGAHPMSLDGVEGTRFAVWAPNAQRVSVVGSFNDWDGRRHPMRLHPGAGVWELFVPGVSAGAVYKYELRAQDQVLLKADPLAFQAEVPPATASVVTGLPDHAWQDAAWMKQRQEASLHPQPVSIYEMHIASWRHGPDGKPLSYDALAEQLIAYVRETGFTHIQFMPVSEHPFSGSWGYQPTGMFAPTSRFGTPEDFAQLVDRCHQAGIGILVDFVPAHFPTDAHGLGHFDGTALYEHADPRLGFHLDWNTLIYNFGRREVQNFLVAAARFWAERFHVDGLRVDAVASMLYLDYSRPHDQWVPNRFGGNHNLEAIEFLKRMNTELHGDYPGATTFAEESTAFDGVSRPVDAGGLGFGFKWNMGWMHDSLAYMSRDPIYRKYHHDEFTFSLVYAWTENFVLPLSHDEVVHGKGSLLTKMPGDRWQKFANLRAYYSYMWTHPGKKLLFMGGEFGQYAEWNHDGQLDWGALQDSFHSGVKQLITDLNHLYRSEPALYRLDCQPQGFEWIDAANRDASVFVYLRRSDDGSRPVVVVCNLTPAPHSGYRIGVPQGGRWLELLNSDAPVYGGSGMGNLGAIDALDLATHGRPATLELTLPPLATLILAPDV